MTEKNNQPQNTEVAVFGGGCFWCTEAVFRRLKGIKEVTPGYAGGDIMNPSYEKVSEGGTGHAEVIKVEFDPAIISYEQLLEIFWSVHDPTTLNRQGADVGTQYRSIILYTNEEQEKAAKKSSRELDMDPHYEGKEITTEILPLGEFYEAEEYHKKYYEKNADKPYCQLVIDPKIEKLVKKYNSLLNQSPQKLKN